MKASSLPSLIPMLLFCIAADFLYGTPIPVESVQKDAAGVTFKMKPGTMRLQVFSDRIIRVIYSPKEALPATQSFVVTGKPVPTKWRLSKSDSEVRLITQAVEVRVSRSTGAVGFYDKAGKALLLENADGGKLLAALSGSNEEAYQVGQTFQCPPDEALFGLGQYQEGLWNWRGLPREFRQHNTTATLPMLISSRGYGVLWDNASITDFNPIDKQVALVSANDAAPKDAKAPKVFTWNGTFTSDEAGEYVFFARADNNREEFSIAIDGKEIAGIKNYWTPFSLCGLVTLPTNKTCSVIVRGGTDVKLFAGRRSNATTFRSQVGRALDYTFFYGPELDDVVRGYRQVTGNAPMWPEWAFGFWQCRERYHDQQELLNAAAEFRRRNIPLDVIVQDWQYWPKRGWGNYEWDTARYPNAGEMIEKLHAENVKFMISLWCNPNGSTREELKKNQAFVNGWVDVFNPLGREIRWNKINEAFFKIGTDAWWGDATEPGDTSAALVGQTTHMGSGDLMHNAYPLFASQSLYEGQRAATSDKRVCILTRSAFPGLQRYASAIWSGDISGDWITMQRQIPAGLNFCLAGIPYWTTDCGGFWHPKDQYTSPDYNELLARWFEWSTFCPILRIHGGDTATEMWNWLPETQKILLAYDELRHRMLPYNYSVAWRVTSEGYTIMRALPLDFRADANALAVGDEYMFGPAFLVAPVTEPQAASRKVYLPAGTGWIDFWTGEKFDGGQTVNASAPVEKIPLFVRAGPIVPLGPSVQYAGEKPADPIELRVYRGADGAFTLYEDEGDNYNYEKGVHSTIPITWDDKVRKLTIANRKGTFPGMLKERTFRVVFVTNDHGIGGALMEKVDAEIHYNGKAVTVSDTK